MPLPVTFATLAQGNQPLSLLDTQFSAFGDLVTIPCTVTGQNALVLTPLPNTPDVPSIHTHQQFSWTQLQTTTGAVTIQVAGGPVLSAFGTNGGVALGAGDLTAGNTYIAMFNDFHGVFVVNAQTPVTSQGSWVPVLAGSSVAGTPVYTTQAGSYEQIGRQVTARFSIITSAITGISGDVRVAGLPFANNATDIGIGFISCFSGWTGTAGFTTIGGVVDGSQTFMRIQESGNGVNSPNAIAAHFAATTALLGVVFYHV